MKTSQATFVVETFMFLSILALSACGAKAVNDTNNKEIEVASESNSTPVSQTSSKPEVVSGISESQQKPKLPEPDLELPTLPYEKSKLPTVQKLDEMLIDDAWLEAAYNLVYKEIQVLEEKTETSMSGTPEDQIKAILTKVNGVKHFNGYAQTIAETAIAKFQEKYSDDSEFGEKFRETYYAAEEEINGGVMNDGKHIIKDDVKRREVYSHFTNGYQPSRTSELRSMNDLLEQSKELTENVIGSVVSQAQTDMMVADYRKGKDIADLLNGTINKLNLVAVLNPDHEEITSMISRVKVKRESRMEEIKQALEEYQFPERYTAGNAPSNATDLENRMKTFLSKSKRTSSKNYEVREIRIASKWFDIRHAITNEHLYSQIDFYVAVPSLEESNVLEVLYVTGKTSGPHHNSFDRYSVGGIGQMLVSNL